jgi:CHAT domain-containing protein
MYTSPAPERRLLAFGASAPGEFDNSAERKYRERLFDLLIPEDIRGRLTPELNLILAPHGNLHNLPFGTLESAGKTLAEQATLSQVPSLAVLEGLLKRKGRTKDEEYTRDQTLLIGIETFKQPKPALRATVNEVQRLQDIYNDRAHSLCLCNERATTSQIHTMNEKQELEKYAVIHFATHASLDATLGTISALSLWDADLAITDIVRLRLGSPTVVLSACQSGLGKIYSGDEASNLAYAFLAAGANSVVASLWHIEDVNTGDLMVAFHHHLQAGRSPARALAEAQREAIQQNVSPYVWGAFRVVGIP